MEMISNRNGKANNQKAKSRMWKICKEEKEEQQMVVKRNGRAKTEMRRKREAT